MSPTIWGPKVWFFLHRLAMYSNRTDVANAWKRLLISLQKSMPCKLCRTHMREYMARQPLIFQTGLNGDGVRDTIVMWLYKFHNSVNGSKGGDEFVFEFLRHFYGTGIHADAVVDARRVLLEIEALWPPTSEWSAAARHLLGLIGGGELG